MPPLESVWAQLALNVAVGMVAGGLTNDVAVRMLFHPREPRFGFQGAIPKNKARLARSIGRMVGERLLSPQDVAAELSQGPIRESFDRAVEDGVRRLLETERGSLRDLLSPPILAEVERVLDGLAPAVGERLEAYLASPEFEGRLAEWVARVRAEIADRPVGAVLTPERQDRIAERAARWAEEVAFGPELERGVREYLSTRAADVMASDKALLDQVPAPVVEAVEAAIDAYLPMAVAKLGDFLKQPRARERLREALHDLFQKFVEDLRFHERVIARLVVTERTFEKVIESLERDGVEQLAALLDDAVVRQEIARLIHEAVLGYLRRPVRDLVGGTDSGRATAIVETVGDALLKAVRSERTRGYLLDRLRGGLERAEHRTWGELLGAVDDATIVRWIAEAARSPRVRDVAEDAVRATLRAAVETPIGRPGRWAPPDAVDRLSAAIAPALWAWIHQQIPGFVAKLDLEAVVERKVLGFSTDRVEELIRGVTQKELDTIVKLGYVLGAFIGIVTFTVSQIVERL